MASHGIVITGLQENLKEVLDMSSSSYGQDFYEIWRFEECAALWEHVKSGAIVFFDRKQSEALWSTIISTKGKHLMTIGDEVFKDMERYEVRFEDQNSADTLFDRFATRSVLADNLILFFGAKSSCILKFSILKNFWNEIFLMSDETSIAVDVKSKVVLFSFEDRFFVADLTT